MHIQAQSIVIAINTHSKNFQRNIQNVQHYICFHIANIMHTHFLEEELEIDLWLPDHQHQMISWYSCVLVLYVIACHSQCIAEVTMSIKK